MKTSVSILALAIFCVCACIYVGGHAKSGTKHRQSIVDEARNHAERADAAYARAWRRVAADHLSDYQLGVHDARFQEVASNSMTSWNSGVIAAMITNECLESVRNKLNKETASYVTNETARDHLKLHDPRVAQLVELGHKVHDAWNAALAFRPESEAYDHVDMDTLVAFVDDQIALLDAVK